jgi:cytoskeletal protein CcmA (bactofilin family)
MNREDKKKRKNKSGQVMIIMVLIIPVILVIFGLTLDIAYVVNQNQNMQNAIDLSALGASEMVNVNHDEVVNNAIKMASQNGLDPNDLIIIHPYLGDNSKVKLKVTSKIQLFFMSILGINSKIISVEAVAQKKAKIIIQPVLKVFDYAVFSGSNSSKITVSGSGSNITGNVHSNEGIKITGSKHVINGNVTAVSGIEKFSTTVNGIVDVSATSVPMIQIDYNAYSLVANKVYNSSQHFSNMDISGVWVVNGDCKINSGKVAGKGILLVNGNLDISGQGLKYQSDNDMLAIYVKGDVQITGSATYIQGIVYVPNGDIKIAGSAKNIEGALIANTIGWTGSNLTINSKCGPSIPSAFTVTEYYNAIIQ